jgi:DNA processing protein
MTQIMKSRDTWVPASDGMLPLAVQHVQRSCSGLWIAGDRSVLVRGVRVAIVGSRLPRADSAAFAQRIATGCAQAGMTVVSGLAMGIDGIAHRAALDAGGETIAVIAGGLGAIHPARHVGMAAEIAGSRSARGVVAGQWDRARGAVVTEYGPGTDRCQPWQFQMRNRIIAALSDYIVVIQARPKSGSLGTATAALDLGIPIGVVPSAPDDSCYTGSIGLIQDGADSVVDVISVAGRLELHGVMRSGFRQAVKLGARIDPDDRGGWFDGMSADSQLPVDGLERAALDVLKVPRVLDDFAERMELDLAAARRALMGLERSGFVHLRPDGCWANNA